ncbi:MAG: xanthine dehydrogenase small subunit [Paracoccaceae bacterium]
MLNQNSYKFKKENFVKFYLNNDLIVKSIYDPQQTLLDFLRIDQNLKGTKEGCAEGDCGACTVLIGRVNKDNIVSYKTANSCILFLPSIDNAHLITVDSLSNSLEELHPIQEAMIKFSGAQCGFCTPGFVMSIYGLFLKTKKPNKKEIVNALQGNLCRCTGYGPIISAAEDLSNNFLSESDFLVKNNTKWAQKLNELRKNNSTENDKNKSNYFIPQSIKQLSEILHDHKNSTIVAGSTDVGLWVNKQFKDIRPIVFINQIDTLKFIKVYKNKISIGSLVTYSDIQDFVSEYFPFLKEYINRIGGDQIRNMGTIGGNIANGSPIGDIAPLFLALGAKMQIISKSSTRKINVENFFIEYGMQAISQREYIHNFEIPNPKTKEFELRAYKVSKRRYEDISTISAAFFYEKNLNKRPNVRFAFGGMAGIPKRSKFLENLFRQNFENDLDNHSIEIAVKSDFLPLTDCRATSRYRLKVAENLFKKFSYLILNKIDIEEIEKGLSLETN